MPSLRVRPCYHALLEEAAGGGGGSNNPRAIKRAARTSRAPVRSRDTHLGPGAAGDEFTEGALSQYATQIHPSWIGDLVDAVIGQTLTPRSKR